MVGLLIEQGNKLLNCYTYSEYTHSAPKKKVVQVEEILNIEKYLLYNNPQR